jgi:uncharacterized protein (TIRG00374 family)
VASHDPSHSPAPQNRAPRDQETAPNWRSIAKRAVLFLLSGLVIYVLGPVLVKVFAAWPRLTSLQPAFVVLGVVSEAAAFACTFALKRIALRTRAFFPVVTAGLVGNAVTNIMPGGDATGAAVEFHMLSVAGVDTGTAVGGLTATAILQTGSLLALPVLALPAVLAGVPIERGLDHLALLGLVMFVLFAAFGLVLFVTDAPLRMIGKLAQDVRNSALRHQQPMKDLPDRLITQRNSTRTALGAKWWQALLFAVGRVGLDFGCLLAMMAATGTSPEPALVLIAYASTTVLAFLPVTPGGLGLVEGSLTGLLILAGVPAADAVLSTLAYRLVSYWLPTLAGPVAHVVFKSRYHTGPDHSSQPEDASNRTRPTEEPS